MEIQETKIYSSKSARAFFDSRINLPDQIPSDAVEITQEYYSQLLEGASNDKVIDFSVEPPILMAPLKTWPMASQLSSNIDDRVAAIYTNWARFDTEHKTREAAALAFKEAGYEGDAGIWVRSYAVPAGLTDAEAADRIIGQAEAQRAATARLAEVRMRKLELSALVDQVRYDRYEAIMAEISDVESSVEGA